MAAKAHSRKAPLPRAPGPRPAQGFSSFRAQRWVMGAALVLAMTYAFRRLVENSVTSAPASGGKVASLLGTGKPPPPLGQWAIAYGAGFLMLSVLAMGAPEVAASLAMMVVVGSTLANGTTVVADIRQLEGKATVAVPTASGGAVLNSLGELAPAAVPGAPLPTLKAP